MPHLSPGSRKKGKKEQHSNRASQCKGGDGDRRSPLNSRPEKKTGERRNPFSHHRLPDGPNAGRKVPLKFRKKGGKKKRTALTCNQARAPKKRKKGREKEKASCQPLDRDRKRTVRFYPSTKGGKGGKGKKNSSYGHNHPSRHLHFGKKKKGKKQKSYSDPLERRFWEEGKAEGIVRGSP